MSTRETSRSVFDKTRAFFKRTEKSDNKLYAENASVGPDKIMRRLAAQESAAPRVSWTHSKIMGGRTMRQYGRWLHQNGTRAVGNCGEMTCVAFYLFALEQEQYACSFPVRFIVVDDPGDHTFLVAGYLPPVVADVPYNQSSSVNVHAMCNAVPDIAESYVVDVWAGIFCSTRVYSFELQLKLAKWSRQGKQVLWREHGWMNPRDKAYVNSLVSSRFRIWGPDTPF